MTLSGQSDHQTPRRSGIDAADLAAALAWWRDAGVDLDFADESTCWLATTEPEAEDLPVAVLDRPDSARAPVAPTEPVATIAFSFPTDLPGFVTWWMGEPSLDAGQMAGRVPPRGSAGAELMVLVDHPEDRDTEILLSGPQGRLLDAILGAAGYARDAVYLASALPRFMPMPDWAGLDRSGLGPVLAHHVALVAPKRLLVFDPHVSSLLGHDPAKTAEPLRQFYHGEARTPALVAPGLAALAARPRGKARLWQKLLEWQAG